jgi:MoaF N-terminal domain
MTTKTNSSKLSDQVCGKTIRLSWADGPTKGTTQEHVFHKDGTVEWHSIETAGKAKPAAESGGTKADKKPEKPHYAGVKITKDICLISYLSQSGYTLTVVLNFADGSTVAIASNEKDWLPAHGSFEVMP